MKDRVPLYPGRVKLIPVSGQENTYDMVRADEPTQEGTPLNKATFLKDATAALFGLDENAVPDDVFSYIYSLFPSNIAVMRIYVEDQYGRPLNAKIIVSPAINGTSTFYTLSNGRLSLQVSEGTYTVTLADSIFYNCSTNVKSITLTNGTIGQIDFDVNSISSGKVYLTSSGEMCVPPWLKPDLFAVGAGGGGGAGAYDKTGAAASGGAGGCTKTILRANINSKNLKYIIGNGGNGAFANVSNGQNGGSGGATSLSTVTGDTILLANGGGGGLGTKATTVSGASGGSGSGGVVNGSVGNAGSNGSNGGKSNGGSGQGTTTREFGEPDGELYCGAGGSATVSRTAGTGGEGGGGNASTTTAYNDNTRAGNGTKYGAGGGASGIASGSYYGHAGSGYKGVLIIRWNEEDAS